MMQQRILLVMVIGNTGQNGAGTFVTEDYLRKSKLNPADIVETSNIALVVPQFCMRVGLYLQEVTQLKLQLKCQCRKFRLHQWCRLQRRTFVSMVLVLNIVLMSIGCRPIAISIGWTSTLLYMTPQEERWHWKLLS